MWIFKSVEWKQEMYYPPEDWEFYLKILIDEFNKQIQKQSGKIHLTDIAIFHLVFYAIHPFWNWNKRTTRVIESLLIQYQFDKLHFLKWMWYWFRKNIDSYFDIIRKILSWQSEAREWLKFYLNHFENMIKYSEISFEVNQSFDISNYIDKSRLYLYSEKDKKLIEHMIVLKKSWINKITSETLLNYVIEQWLVKEEQFKWYKKKFSERLARFEKDNLIEKTWEKDGKRYIYEILID